MSEAFWLNLSTEWCFFPSLLLFLFSLPFSFSWFAHPVCAASHTSTPSVSNFLYLSLHQGAEAQSDTAAQWAQVPDTWLHRVSEEEVWLLWPHVADPTERHRKRGREGGREVKMSALLLKSQFQHQTWEVDILFFSTELLTEWKWIWIACHPLSEMWI